MDAAGSAVKENETVAEDGAAETTIASTEAAASFSDVMDRVFAGEQFRVTRYDKVRMYMIGPKRYEQLLESERAVLAARNASLARR